MWLVTGLVASLLISESDLGWAHPHYFNEDPDSQDYALEAERFRSVYVNFGNAVYDLRTLVKEWVEDDLNLSDHVITALIDYSKFLQANFRDSDAEWLSDDERAEYWQQWYADHAGDDSDSDSDSAVGGVTANDKKLIDAFVKVFDPVAEYAKISNVVISIEEFIDAL